MKTKFACLMALVLFAACNEPAATTPDPEETARMAQEEAAEARKEIEAANAAITSLLRESKYEEAAAYFSPNLIQMISGQPPIRGREAWIEAQRQAGAIGSWDLELEVLDFEYHGDAAVERGRGIQTFTANENSPMPSMQTGGDYMVYWVKTDAGWQIQWDYVVLDAPETGPEGSDNG